MQTIIPSTVTSVNSEAASWQQNPGTLLQKTSPGTLSIIPPAEGREAKAAKMKNKTELISQKSNIRICVHIVSRPLSSDVHQQEKIRLIFQNTKFYMNLGVLLGWFKRFRHLLSITLKKRSQRGKCNVKACCLFKLLSEAKLQDAHRAIILEDFVMLLLTF